MQVRIANREYDPQICKYSGITPYLRDSIRNNYLWFSDPVDFNDPYDLNLNLILPGYSKRDLLEFAAMIVQKGLGKGHSPDTLAQFFIDNPPYLKESMQRYADGFASTIGVSCFSQNEDNFLMWSHYADKHKGICLKFEMHKDPNFFTIPVKVDYPEKYPQFDYFSLRKTEYGLVQFLVGTKSADWSSENEIRIVKPKSQFEINRGKITFNKDSLVEVIFGYKCNLEDANEIKGEMLGVGYTCKFFKATLKKSDFGLRKVEL
jgi:Protein of unknown function (DUF2971)